MLISPPRIHAELGLARNVSKLLALLEQYEVPVEFHSVAWKLLVKRFLTFVIQSGQLLLENDEEKRRHYVKITTSRHKY